MPSKPSSSGTLDSGGRVAEMLVDEPETVQHLPETVRADRDHQRQADGRVVGVTPADPVPELEHVRRVDPELGDLPGVRRQRDEMLRDGPVVTETAGPSSSQSRAEVALVIVSMVVNVFDATMNNVSAGSRSRMASCRSAPSTFDTNRKVSVAVGERAQRLVRHRRTQIRTADTDVDHVPDPPARVARPLTRAHPPGEVGHPVQHRVDPRDDVLPVDLDHRTRPEHATPCAARPGPR